MPELSFSFWLAIALSLAFLFGVLAKKFRQPVVIGYLIAGLFLGQIAASFSFPYQFLETLSEIGLAFLLFTLGLELSFDHLKQVGKTVVLGAVLQIMLTLFLGLILLPWFGLSFTMALFIAAGFALSSTAIVVKILVDREQINTLEGQILLGWLLVQDLAVLPMVVILPALGQETIAPLGLFLSLVKAVIFLSLTFFLGKKIMPWIIKKLADLQSREIFLLAVVAFCLLIASLTSFIGFSFSLGAFLAGLILTKVNERQAVFIEIRPLRDFFSALFFLSLGLLINLSFLVANLPLILLLSVSIVLIKFLLVFLILFFLRFHLKTVIICALSLVQVGEFAFVLSRLGLHEGLIDVDTHSLVASVALITIFVTPFLIGSQSRFYFWLQSLLKRTFPNLVLPKAKNSSLSLGHNKSLKNHVIICGYGRVGSWLGKALIDLKKDFLIIDYNHRLITRLRDQGLPVLYGDPTDQEILKEARVDQAELIALTIPDIESAQLVTRLCRNLNPKIKVLARAHRQSDKQRLFEIGVEEVVHPEHEAALVLVNKLLKLLTISSPERYGESRRLKHLQES